MLPLKYRIVVVKTHFGSLIKFTKISKLIDRESKLKPVYCLFLTQKNFYNTLLYVLQNTNVHGLQLSMKTAVKNIVNLSRYRKGKITSEGN